MLSSSKLRWFVLKQEQEGEDGEHSTALEYYEGRTLRGGVPLSQLCHVVVRDRFAGAFALVTPPRIYELRTERENMGEVCDVM